MFGRHYWAMTRKELIHIWRNPGTLILILLMPTLLLLILAYSLTADITNVPVAVFDQDGSQLSRAFIDQITAGNDLNLTHWVNSDQEIENLFQSNQIKAVIILAPDFSKKLSGVEGLPLQIIIDGTEPQSGWFALDHIVNRAEKFAAQQLSSVIGDSTLNPIDVRINTLYNPDLKSSVSLIPGLLSMVVGLPGLSIALSLAREREHGTLEQLMTTPLRRAELLLGKISPYILGGLINVVLTTIVARYWFKVPFNGNFLLFFILSSVFLFAILSMGILIGVFIKTQPGALALSFLLIFFPGFFLTGIFFPITSMPEEMQLEAMFLPGTHYATVTRGAFLTGVGLNVLWLPAVAMLGMGIIFTVIGAIFFEKKLA